jgi:hypothetical protein
VAFRYVKASTLPARPLYGNWTDLTVATYTARIIVHGTPAIGQASNDILASSSS